MTQPESKQYPLIAHVLAWMILLSGAFVFMVAAITAIRAAWWLSDLVF